MKKIQILLSGVMLSFALQAQTKSHSELRRQLSGLISSYKATTGIAMIDLETGDTLTINNAHHYPMQSTYKLPLAIAVLRQVDMGKLSLDQKVHVRKKDVAEDTWSPIREKYPKGNVDLTLLEVLQYTISQSDNIGCDLLFRLMTGTEPVNGYIHSIGIDSMFITATEAEMYAAWGVQYTNWSHPMAMTELLQGLYQKKYLDEESNRLLIKIMEETSTGPNRMKGLLPTGMIVAHKTGTSGQRDGVRAACNDVGVITLSNGKHIALTVFVSDSHDQLADEEKEIALISKAVVDYFQDSR